MTKPILFDGKSEEELRQMSEDFGDAEFEAEVASTLGPLGETELDANRHTTVLYPKHITDQNLTPTTRGMAVDTYATDDLIEDKGAQRELARDLSGLVSHGTGHNAKDMVKKAVEADDASVFTFGAENATPYVQSHEVRHIVIESLRNAEVSETAEPTEKTKALKFLKESMPSQRSEESWNRAFDKYRTEDPDVIITEMVKVARGKNKMLQIKGKEPKYIHKDKKFYKDVLSDVFLFMKLKEKEFAKIEAAAQILEGQPEPKGGWTKFYMKKAKQRRNGLAISVRERLNQRAQALEQR